MLYKKILKKHQIFKMMRFWPPFLGAGIKVVEANPELTHVKVQMKLKSWNSNYVGTHYGGSLYSMVDPFYMLMLLFNLGSDYVVWDKSASIRFRRPAKGKVTATFTLTNDIIEKVKTVAENEDKTEPQFLVEIKDDHGNTVAEVDKVIFVQQKAKFKARNKN